MNMKKGFTLVELLLVIGIIGLLAAVTISQFGGATETAKITQCKANLRNLAIAVQNTAERNEHGEFPAAGSFKYVDFGDRKTVYRERHGWVSWGKSPGETSKGGGAQITFSVSDDEQRRWAITNGAIWSAVGGAVSSYQCPVHAKAFYKANRRNPAWSYVMNQAFGFDENYGSGPLAGWKGLTLDSANGDRRLLFAEVQGLDDEETGLRANTEGSGTAGDGVLQYSKNEVIGFNHKTARGLSGHVAFADGHVETISYPHGGLSPSELTKALCEAHEIRFDGKRYEDLSR